MHNPEDSPLRAWHRSAAAVSPTGVHKVCVIFQTRQGYLTKPGPATKWTASAANAPWSPTFPPAPSNVVERILCFTGAGGASFSTSEQAPPLFTGNMNRQQTTPARPRSSISPTASFSPPPPSTISSAPIELGCFAAVIDYAQRLFWFGERNKLNNFVNLGFDGGFTGPSLPPTIRHRLERPIQSSRPAAPMNKTLSSGARHIRSSANGSTATRRMMTQAPCKILSALH